MDMVGEGLRVQRRDWSPRKEQCLCFTVSENCVLQSLKTTSFRCWGFVWIRFWGPYVGPCFVILKLCVCVFPHKMFPSYTSQVNCELSKHFLSPLHIDYTLPDSFLNLVIPQIWLIFIFLNWRWHWGKRSKVRPPILNIQTENLRVVPVWQLWTPDLHWSLSHAILTHGAMRSLHLCPCLEGIGAPEVQTMPIIRRWAQWSWNSRKP